MWLLAMAALVARAGGSDSLTVEDLKENGVHFTPDNRVTLLPSGTEKFDDLFRAIEQARKYVYLEYFNLRNDSIGKALFTLLDRKEREGVKVRVIYDDFGNVSNDRRRAGISTSRCSTPSCFLG